VKDFAASHVDLIATFRPEQVRARRFLDYVKAGVTIVRLNGSHCNTDELRGLAEIIKSAGINCLLDLPGPELRIFGYDKPIHLTKGQSLHIGMGDGMLKTNFTQFEELMPCAPATFMSGEIEAFVLRSFPDSFTLAILNSGTLNPNAHITFPTLSTCLPYPSERDIDLIRLACELRWDYIALSMLSNSEQIDAVSELIGSRSPNFSPRLAAKIETPAALESLGEIIPKSDAVFVARGDLGTQIEMEYVPIAQKEIISACKAFGKPVWVATQMLLSMTKNVIPTRAEVSDVANAVIDGATGITLSEETAVGKHPLEAIKAAQRIINTTSEYLNPKNVNRSDTHTGQASISSPELANLIQDLGHIGSMIWTKGWAEANAGNVSVRVDDHILEKADSDLHWYIVSRSGSRYRQLSTNPKRDLLLVSDNGKQWKTRSSQETPTSEWNTHLALQRWFISSGRNEKVILHAHPEPIVALGNLDIFANEALLNSTLASLLPELPLYLPEGIACCPFHPPGSEALAQQTLVCAPRSRVIIWQKHGILCCAPDPDAAFDLMEIVTKAVSLYLTKLSLS
jgi:pyruvate kinase